MRTLRQCCSRIGAVTVGIIVAPLLAANAASIEQPGLPADIQNVIRKQYDGSVRYFDRSVDLNGDGKPEVVVYLVGQMACGSGGCPTLVFTPAASGYRLVSTTTVTNPPIRASSSSTAGWRNLIVRVRGGGAKAGDVELASDGKGYPGNPTVPGVRVKPASGRGSEELIKEFASFDAAAPLDDEAAAGAAAPQSAAGQGPSFDCAKASTPVEKLVCADAGLATLDRTLNDAYTKAMAQWPDDIKTSERNAQRIWIARRNACAKDLNAKACVESSYRRRLIEVQIRGGQLEAPKTATFACKGQDQPLTTAFYNQTQPNSVAITLGDRQTIAFSAPSGSGARYTGPDIEFWEHQGEATVKWAGATFVCKPK